MEEDLTRSHFKEEEDMKICFVDVETTGLDPKVHAIIQLSGSIQKGDLVDEFDYRLKPFKGDMLSPSTTAVHGYTKEDIEKFPESIESYNKFIKLLDSTVNKYDKKDKLFLAAFNATFDDGFLRRLFEKCGNKFYGSYFWWPPLDVAILAAEYLKETRHTMPDFKLSTVYATIFGTPFIDAHDALADIKATREIYLKVAGRCE